MSHIKVVINGEQMMDDNLGNWTARPPEFLKRMVTPGGPKPEPHILAIGVVISNAVLMGEDAAIDVTVDDGGWSMQVARSFAIALPSGD